MKPRGTNVVCPRGVYLRTARRFELSGATASLRQCRQLVSVERKVPFEEGDYPEEIS